MEKTERLELKKPGYDDPADIQELNSNADKIDQAFSEIENRITAHMLGGF